MKTNFTKLTLITMMMMAFLFNVTAQEGMWLLNQIDQLDLNKKGLQLAPGELYNKDKVALNRAIVQLGGGTASFVSKDGLLITNHHVAFGALQRTSSVKSDYLTNGFLARQRSEEIQAPGYQASLMISMTDVTNEVVAAAAGISDPLEREKKMDEKIAKMSEEIRKGKEDIRVYIASNFNGKQYIQYVYKTFRDVRIVYAPPMSVGNYGGEIDNWMWPRHTADFSFLRVYAAPDGTGRAYHKENVPYHPEVYLKVADGYLKDGDFTFIIGYPGQTTRYRSSTSVHWNENVNYPFTIKNFREIIDLLEETTKNNHEGEIKVAGLKKGLANVMKNNQGKVDGMKKTRFYEKKLEFEKQFQAWANSQPERKAKYGDILKKEKAEYEVLAKTKTRDNVFGVFQGLAGMPLTAAQNLLYFAQQKDKPAGERDPGYTEENIARTIENLPFTYNNYFEPADKALFVRALKMAAKLPADQRITGIEYILQDGSMTPEQFADQAFKTTRLTDMEFTKTLFDKSVKELEALNDPFIRMAISMDPMSEEMNEINRRFGANVVALRKIYLEGLFEWKGTGLYPDANSTIRFTWGRVKGYKPRDAVWYDPFTTFAGVVEKNTGMEPFDAPADLVALYDRKDLGRWADPAMKDIPVAFLSQCDITGGNSGSPIMNGKGEIVGVAFDGNYESMISDWQYDLKLQRCISVDIHYVLFITEKLGKAGFILDEMGVRK
jgi:hypothetical protein